MQRRSFLSAIAAFAGASVFGQAAPVCAQTPPATSYTFTYPGVGQPLENRKPAVSYSGDLVYQLTVSSESAKNGGQTVRLQTKPGGFPSFLGSMTSHLTTDAEGSVLEWDYVFGTTPSQPIHATRLPSGAGYQIGVPEKSGSVLFGGKLISPLVAQLFIGRQYNWAKGGPQNFAWIYDSALYPDVRVVTLTLTALNGGKAEPLTLAQGVVQARKLRAEANLPFLRDKAAQTLEREFWVGPTGEVVRCDNDFFGLPFKAQAAAKSEGTRRELAFERPENIPQIPRIVIKGDKRGTAQAAKWDIGLEYGEARSPQTLARAECDANFQLTYLENPWRGRPTKMQVVGNQLNWQIEAEKGEIMPPASGRTFWFPSWFVTALWEGPGRPFANLEVNGGEKRDGLYFPITGQKTPDAFTLERLADTSATVGGQKVPVRHYRFDTQTAFKKREITDIYTDGSRLIAALGSNKSTIIQGGWEAWAKAFPFPDMPTNAPEKAAAK